MDAHYDFMICDVPDEETVSKITSALQKVLFDEFGTEIYIHPSIED